MNYYRTPYYYPYPYCDVPSSYRWQRSLPPVDTKIFEKSVHDFPKLMHDGTLLLQKLADPAFSYQLMVASQAGHQEEVNRMLKTIGTEAPIHARFTPTGVTFTLESDDCTLHMSLRWGA